MDVLSALQEAQFGAPAGQASGWHGGPGIVPRELCLTRGVNAGPSVHTARYPFVESNLYTEKLFCLGRVFHHPCKGGMVRRFYLHFRGTIYLTYCFD